MSDMVDDCRKTLQMATASRRAGALDSLDSIYLGWHDDFAKLVCSELSVRS